MESSGTELGRAIDGEAEAPPRSGVTALHHLAAKIGSASVARPSIEPARAKLTLEPSRLSEEDLRRLIGELAQTGTGTFAFVLGGPRAQLEPAMNLAELYWKLVERRVFGAVFTYERGGSRYEDRIVSTPGGFSLQRTVQN